MKLFEELDQYVNTQYQGIGEQRSVTLLHLRHAYLQLFKDGRQTPNPQYMAEVIFDLLELPEKYASVPHELFVGAISDSAGNLQLIFGVAFFNEDKSSAICFGSWENQFKFGFRSFRLRNSPDNPTLIQDAVQFDINRVREHLIDLDEYVIQDNDTFTLNIN